MFKGLIHMLSRPSRPTKAYSSHQVRTIDFVGLEKAKKRHAEIKKRRQVFLILFLVTIALLIVFAKSQSIIY